MPELAREDRGAHGMPASVDVRAGLRLKWRLIVSSAVSQTGNWLTFLAVVLAVQSTYGSAASAGVFFAQTLPAIVGARAISDRIPPGRAYQAWAAIQFALAGLSLFMCLAYRSLLCTYAFVMAAMLLRAVANPLLFTLITTSVDRPVRESTYVAVSAAGSLTLIVSPALGGVLAEALGVAWLFAVDAATFVIAVAILRPRYFRLGPHLRLVPEQIRDGGARAGRRSMLAWAKRPERAGPLLKRGMAAWFAFMLTGALLNAVEMPRFQRSLAYSAHQIGLALAAYGVGGAIALAVSSRRAGWSVPSDLAAAAYSIGVCAWAFGSGALPFLGFLVLGFCSAAASGAMRGALATLASHEGVSQQALWGWVNQTVLCANLLMYTTAGVLFLVGTPLWIPLAALIAAAAGWTLLSHLLVAPGSATGRILAEGSEE